MFSEPELQYLLVNPYWNYFLKGAQDDSLEKTQLKWSTSVSVATTAGDAKRKWEGKVMVVCYLYGHLFRCIAYIEIFFNIPVYPHFWVYFQYLGITGLIAPNFVNVAVIFFIRQPISMRLIENASCRYLGGGWILPSEGIFFMINWNKMHHFTLFK